MQRAGLADQVLQALESRASVSRASTNGDFKTLCPFHDDTKPSLSWHPDKGVFCCFGCGAKGTTRSLAEKLSIHVGPLTVEELATAKGIPVEWVKEHKLARQATNGVQIPYRDETGKEVAIRTRLNLSEDGRGGRFRWRRGDYILPYGLWLLQEQKAHFGYTWIVEGETDAWTLWLLDLPGIGVPGANNWQPKWASYFHGFEKVYFWLEPDIAGYRLLRDVAHDLPGLLVIKAPPGVKDINDFYVRKGPHSGSE